MKQKKGGIKTSILLFSLLVVLALLLFLFVFSIFSNNKLEVTKKLTNANDCMKINYNIIRSEYKSNNLAITLRNDINSANIDGLNIYSDGKNIKVITEINPGETKIVEIQNLTLGSTTEIYANECNEYNKRISTN